MQNGDEYAADRSENVVQQPGGKTGNEWFDKHNARLPAGWNDGIYPDRFSDGAGISKREYMATALLPAVISATSAGRHVPVQGEGDSLPGAMARDAVMLADALLLELAK